MNLRAFKGRSLVTWKDFSATEILRLLDLSVAVKRESRRGRIRQRFTGKTIALIFEKRSTRTRCAFETAFGEEGGHPVFLSTQDIQLGSKESIEDTARVLGRMFSAIEFRGFHQSTLEILAREAGVPVYNGLTDSYHPTQVLADILTIQETFGTIKGRSICYIGDGGNNVARSLMVICAKLGINYLVISPPELSPDPTLLAECQHWAAESGSVLRTSENLEAVIGADVLYTDVWVSMGEEEQRERKKNMLAPYQVNDAVIKKTGRSDTIFLHCLPAVKGEEVTVDVIEGPQSRVWDQAENRKHTIKAILLATI